MLELTPEGRREVRIEKSLRHGQGASDLQLWQHALAAIEVALHVGHQSPDDRGNTRLSGSRGHCTRPHRGPGLPPQDVAARRKLVAVQRHPRRDRMGEEHLVVQVDAAVRPEDQEPPQVCTIGPRPQSPKRFVDPLHALCALQVCRDPPHGALDLLVGVVPELRANGQVLPILLHELLGDRGSGEEYHLRYRHGPGRCTWAHPLQQRASLVLDAASTAVRAAAGNVRPRLLVE
mmetsp:Transcript_102759/g.257714  ORF Transcript_102759/g.257714 Transcript_102759/m.257714 type:complete len:233 (+) Transcript_102759:490-1188(+)